jgi:hypothetical protein
MKSAILLLGLVFAGAAGAQGLYKCKDAAGKITYAGRECALLGLQSAGEIRDSMSNSPAPDFPKAKPDAPAPAGQAAVPAKADEKKDEDDRRCFKTAKGYRCNEKPDEK